jgi:hypothetical protein
LEKLHWQPSLDENGAWYWVIKHEWQKCIEVGTGAAGPLISVLKDGDEEVRRCAADALIKIGASSIEPLLADLRRVELLITDLKSSDRDVRRRAAQSISELRRSKTIDLRIEPLVLKIVGRMKRSHKDFENHEDSRGAYEKGCGSLVDMMAHTDFEDYSLDFPL